jgi:hypothetical protein
MQQAAPGNGLAIRDSVCRGLKINAFHKKHRAGLFAGAACLKPVLVVPGAGA